MGIEDDASNKFGYRYTDGVLSVFFVRAGVERVITKLNGNDNNRPSDFVITRDVFPNFSIEYLQAKIVFLVDGEALHVEKPTTQSLCNMGGRCYISVTNGATAIDNSIISLGLAVYCDGGMLNAPKTISNSAGIVGESLLKTGDGIIHSISITRASGSSSTLTVYDNTSGSGEVIAVIDMSKTESVGVFDFSERGVSFGVGLYYVVTGNPNGAAFNICWE